MRSVHFVQPTQPIVARISIKRALHLFQLHLFYVAQKISTRAGGGVRVVVRLSCCSRLGVLAQLGASVVSVE